MSYDPERHHRRSIRFPGFNYSAFGPYFVTICVEGRECLFGDVRGGQMILNDAGQMVDRIWREMPDHYPGVQIDQLQVMPNHLHGIVGLAEPASEFGEGRTWGSAPTGGGQARGPAPTNSNPNTKPLSLGDVLQRFKSFTTTAYVRGVSSAGWTRFDGRLWQRNYFEHIIRDNESLGSVRSYIFTNPQRWGADRENPLGDGSDDVETFVASLDAAERDAGSTPDPSGDVASPLRQTRAYGDVPLQNEMITPPFRIGHGYDLHRLQPGGKLMLAGIEVSQTLSPIAHSDGDVVIHALVDALLGALAWGDIGELFPNTDPQWKDAPSRVFLEHVYAKVRAEGYSLVNADVTILAERPKLKSFKPAMRQFLENLLGGTINVKAGTNEGCDAIGRGEAIAAHAVVLLAKSE